jgi:hypothetical protein
MNTTLLTLAIVCLVIAVFAACRRDPTTGRRDVPTAAAGTVGALLFFIAAIIKGSDDHRDC